MANIEVEAGRIPVSRGPWSSGVTVYKFNRFTYLGSEYEATADGLTNAPGSIVNNYPVANTGWRLTSVGMGEGIIESKADKDTDAVAGNVAEYDNSGNPVDSGFGMSDIAKKNSTVPSMTSGYSHGVVNPDTPGDDVELVSRAYPGVNGIANVKGFEGKTLAWNQLVNPNTADASKTDSGITFTKNGNGSITVSGTATAQVTYMVGSYDLIAGHKYMLKGCPVGGSEGGFFLYLSDGGVAASDLGDGVIATPRQSGNMRIRIVVASNTIITNAIMFYPQLIDLTLMFGSGNEPATVEEFEAMFPNSYYPYNAGELISNSADGIEIVGFNQWDEETLLGYYTASGVYYSSNDQLCTKNYIPVISGETYYFGTDSTYQTRGNICYYDANKNFIRRDDSSATFTVPSGASYIMMSFGTLYGHTYNHDICINLSSGRNGEYEPYKRSVLPLHLDSFKVKSPNIWDEEWENGRINTTTGQDDAGTKGLRSKNYICVEADKYYSITRGNVGENAYLLFYDNSKNFIGYRDASSGAASAYHNAVYARFYIPTSSAVTSYNNDVMVNLSGWANGKYFPHGVLTLEGGLKSAGSVKDEIVGNKYIKRVGEVDLGTKSYSKLTSCFISDYGVNDMAGKRTPAMVCGRYTYADSDIIWRGNAGDKVIGNSYVVSSIITKIQIYDSALASLSSTDFQTAMSGVMLYYELATPQVYEIIDQLPCNYRTYEGGTEARVSDHLCTPLMATISYQKDFVASTNLEIMDLKNHGIAEGIADSISAGVAQEFTFRQSGGDGVNYMKRIKGKTMAWNQLIDGNVTVSGTINGVTRTKVGNYFHLNGTAQETTYGPVFNWTEIKGIVGHKYLYLFYAKGTGADHLKYADQYQNTGARVGSFIFTANSATVIAQSYLENAISYDCDVYANVVDLTLLFGSGNEPSTVAEFEALYPELYYPYNAGELISNDASGIETVGRNVWDEEWELGYLDQHTGEPTSGGGKRAKNFISVFPSTTYYGKSIATGMRIFEYDADKNLITCDPVVNNETFVTSNKSYFIKFQDGTPSYANDICINLSDASRNGTYEPYWKRKIDLNLDSFKVKDKAGNIITVNGLKSAGSVYDEIVGNKYIKRIGEVDLGSLNWTKDSIDVFRATLSDVKKSATSSSIANIINPIYPATSPYLVNSTDKTIAIDESAAQVGIKDTTYSNATSFKTAMSGVMLYYELATPVEYQLVKPMPNCILVDDLGTEKAVYPDHQSAPSAPFNCDSNYSISIPKLIAKLNE